MRALEGEGVVRGLHMRTDAQGIFMDDIAVLRRVALRVVHIPTECGEERVEELPAKLSLVVTAGAVVIAVIGEGFAEFEDGVGCGHGEDQLKLSMAVHQPIRVSPETRSKWASRLRTGSLCWRAMAAIHRSFIGMGVPAEASCRRIST